MLKINTKLGIFVSFFLISQWAHSIDLQPNDIVAPPPDITVATISYVNSQNNSFYLNGLKLSGTPDLENNAALLRLARTYTIASLPAVTYIQVGASTLSTDGSLARYPSSKGMTDTTITTAIWPYADHVKRRYLGLAAYLSLPTGEYSNTKPLNVGSNRYSQALQIGYQQAITGSLDAAMAFDTTWFGANSQCAATCNSLRNVQLTQKPLYSAQLGPIYRLNQTYTVAATYVYSSGAESAFNGIEQNNTVVTQRYFVSAVANYHFGRVTLQYGNDLATMNGFMESRRVVLRYAKPF